MWLIKSLFVEWEGRCSFGTMGRCAGVKASGLSCGAITPGVFKDAFVLNELLLSQVRNLSLIEVHWIHLMFSGEWD